MAVKRALSWPPPVYVATFADGTVCRMSCGSYEKKLGLYDFGKGRRTACSAIGAERVHRAHREANPNHVDSRGREWAPLVWHPDKMPPMPPATDIVAGHFEDGDKIIPDPFFLGEEAPAAKKVSTLSRLIASLNKLSPDDLARLSVEVDARLEAAE